MALSRSGSGALRRWAARAIAAFLVVYLLGAFGVPTLVPYLAVALAVVVDGARSLIVSRASRRRVPLPFDRNETIH
jgi:hypothetical protein